MEDSSPTPMSVQELVAIGERVFGRWGWQRRMAQVLALNENTIRRWKSGEWPVNERLVSRIRNLKAPGEKTNRRLFLELALTAGGKAKPVERGDELGIEASDKSWMAWENNRASIQGALDILLNEDSA